MATTQKVTQPLKWRTAQNLLSILKSEGNKSYAELNDGKRTKQNPKQYHNLRLMFAIGFYTGFRISDILNIKWDTITDEKNKAVKEFTLTEKKTKKSRTVQVNKDLAKIINETYKADTPTDYNDFVFTDKKSQINKPISVQAANKRIKKVFTQFEIDAANPSSHTLRKTFGMRVYEKYGQSENALITLSQIFNHSSIAMTRKYIGITQEKIKAVYLNL